MSEENKNNSLFKKIQNFIFTNYIQIIISLVILLIIFVGFQIFNYFKIQDIKNSSLSFFNIIQAERTGCHIITATNDIISASKNFGKDLNEYSLETVKMFYDDALKSGFKL